MTFVLVLVLFAVVSQVTVTAKVLSRDYGEIPNLVYPIQYTLEVFTDLDQLSYSGTVSIQLLSLRKTNKICLHVNTRDGTLGVIKEGVKLHPLSHYLENYVTGIEESPETDFLIVTVEPHLKAGAPYNLEISFVGMLEEKEKGYYIIRDPTDLRRSLALTQFGKAMARNAFPCFDQPEMKSIFIIKLGVKEGQQSFTGMPLKTETKIENRPGWVLREYEETPPLSTFQLSFLVSGIPLEAKQTCDSITYWYRRGFNNIGNLNCDITGHASRLYKKIGLPNIFPKPLAKLDFILLPSVKNNNLGVWGLITTKEVKDFTEHRSREDLMILYERLAWQIFGGGVISPSDHYSTWVFLSLSTYIAGLSVNEFYDSSFQSFMQICAVETWQPEFSLESEPRVEDYLAEFSQMPKFNEIELKKECKGVLLFQMLHKTLGDEMFKKGLQEFFHKYKYLAAGADELWKVFNSIARGVGGAAGQITPFQMGARQYRLLSRKTPFLNVKLPGRPGRILNALKPGSLPFGVTMEQVMEGWTNNYYYPVLTVIRQDSGFVQVSQRTYIGNFYEKKKLDEVLREQCFWIPLTYSTSRKPNFSITRPMDWTGCEHGAKGYRFNAGIDKKEWIIFNNQNFVPYRVNYDEEGWNLIIEALKDKDKFTKIDTMNRAQLVNDAMSLGFTADLSYEVVFRLLTYLRNEQEFVVWQYFFLNSWNLFDGLKRTDVYEHFQEYVRYILTPIYQSTFTDTARLTEYITKNKPQYSDADVWKLTLFSQAGDFNVPNCVDYCKGLFSQWKSRGVIPTVTELYPQTLLKYVLCIAISEGTTQDFKFLYKQLMTSKRNDGNRMPYIYAISCASNEADVKRMLDWTFSSTYNEFSIRDQEKIFHHLADRSKSYKLVLNYFYQNFNKIYKFNSDPAFMAKNLEILGFRMDVPYFSHTHDEIDETMKILKPQEELMKSEIFDSALMNIRSVQKNKSAWLEANIHSIQKALEAWQNTPQ